MCSHPCGLNIKGGARYARSAPDTTTRCTTQDYRRSIDTIRTITTCYNRWEIINGYAGCICCRASIRISIIINDLMCSNAGGLHIEGRTSYARSAPSSATRRTAKCYRGSIYTIRAVASGVYNRQRVDRYRIGAGII